MKLLCKLFGHKLKNTHYNRFGTPTRRECRRCGYSEEQKHPPLKFGDDYIWYKEK